jgi:hypothetical protein
MLASTCRLESRAQAKPVLSDRAHAGVVSILFCVAGATRGFHWNAIRCLYAQVIGEFAQV